MTLSTRVITLKCRPEGVVDVNNFEIKEIDLVELQCGEILLRTVYLSLDPYMRGRMSAAKSYAGNFEVGEPLIARGVGEVILSESKAFTAGDLVVGMMKWADYSVIKHPETLRVIDVNKTPLPNYLGPLGMPGLTAWVGMKNIGKPKVGETLFVSAASGAVGQIASQMGKISGCRVVGCAGTDKKVSYLINQMGLDAAFNHNVEGDYLAALRRCCPEGIDINFENVGGKLLEAVLEQANDNARFVQCGVISQYNLPHDKRFGIRNIEHIHRKRIRMEGFIVGDHWDRLDEFISEMMVWLNSGAITYKLDITSGLERAPVAFIAMMGGGNFGKTLVQVDDEP
ncbi:MAG: hypothetical protein CBB68_03500 [Rhodospirillaceae bacterium TMED8]|nr:NADP-dependent oxidoreductase [Magnetovibrio sp.]OUT51949.1 MAG: hypothetical protein CBB68_03500 [Rhodospirillaceae bacterium TMED8]